jgi:glycosyltransferase involved in cell wall biosynthesis
MLEPLVTIGIGNYNNEKYVLDTLKSVKEQTYPNIELVIIDDCSTDNSLYIIKEWLKTCDKPYKLIVHEKNKGVCAVCNAILNNASGKYVSFLATDDLLMPDKTRKHVEILENTEVDVCAVYSDAYLIKENGSLRFGMFIQRYRDFEDAPSGNIFEQLLLGGFIPGMAVLVKRACYVKTGLFDESLVFEDYDMWLRLASEYKIIFSDYVSAKYRVRANSLTSTNKTWDASRIKIYAKHVKESPVAINQLERVVINAYLMNDREALALLPAIKNVSNRIRIVAIAWSLRLPAVAGKVFLKLAGDK